MNENNINNENLIKAIKNTFNNRNTEYNINRFKEIIELLKESNALKQVYSNYQNKLEYTKNVSFEDTINAITKVANILKESN